MQRRIGHTHRTLLILFTIVISSALSETGSGSSVRRSRKPSRVKVLFIFASAYMIRDSHVKPGGWVEWQEKHPLFYSDDGSLKEDSAIATWGKTFFKAANELGTPASSPRHLKGWMLDAGFTDVEEHILKLPVGLWPKDKRLKNIGLFEMVNMDEGLGSLSMMLFTRALKWTPQEVELFLMDVRKDAKDSRIHSYYHL